MNTHLMNDLYNDDKYGIMDVQEMIDFAQKKHEKCAQNSEKAKKLQNYINKLQIIVNKKLQSKQEEFFHSYCDGF